MKVNLIFSIIFLWYEISLACGMGLPERVSTLENTVGEIKKDQEKIETKLNALVNNLDKISDVLTAIEAFIEASIKPCPPGVDMVQCFKAPCQDAVCEGYPAAKCRDNYCGGCNAEWTIAGQPVECGCPKDAPLASCFEDPCSVETCKEHPDAECYANYCGGCNAEFFVNGKLVQCTSP